MGSPATSRLVSPWLLLVLIVPGACADSGAADKEDGFLNPFNGRNLEGWVVEGAKDYEGEGETKPVWTIVDGNVHCAGKGYGFLRYEKKLCDFELHLEFHMAEGANSGLGIRGVAFTGPFETRPSAAGYEIQLLDDAGKPPTEHSTGSLYRYVAPSSNAVKPAGAWNVVEIECVGPRIRITLNGTQIQNVDQTTLDAIKEKPLCGFISLQNHGGKIEFRNVRVKELKSP